MREDDEVVAEQRRRRDQDPLSTPGDRRGGEGARDRVVDVVQQIAGRQSHRFEVPTVEDGLELNPDLGESEPHEIALLDVANDFAERDMQFQGRVERRPRSVRRKETIAWWNRPERTSEPWWSSAA